MSSDEKPGRDLLGKPPQPSRDDTFARDILGHPARHLDDLTRTQGVRADALPARPQGVIEHDLSVFEILKEKHVPGLAERMRDLLIELINDYEQKLADDQDICMMIPSVPQIGEIDVDEIASVGDSIVVFYSNNQEGNKVRLALHHTQAGIYLYSRKKPSSREEPRRFGFLS